MNSVHAGSPRRRGGKLAAILCPHACTMSECPDHKLLWRSSTCAHVPGAGNIQYPCLCTALLHLHLHLQLSVAVGICSAGHVLHVEKGESERRKEKTADAWHHQGKQQHNSTRSTTTNPAGHVHSWCHGRYHGIVLITPAHSSRTRQAEFEAHAIARPDCTFSNKNKNQPLEHGAQPEFQRAAVTSYNSAA